MFPVRFRRSKSNSMAERSFPPGRGDQSMSSLDTRPARPDPAAQPRLPSRPAGDPLWARLLVVVGALLMLASGGAIIGEKYLVSRYTAGIAQRTFAGSGSVSHVSVNGVVNFLLAGVDERPDNGTSVRADSIIVLHIPADHSRAYLI